MEQRDGGAKVESTGHGGVMGSEAGGEARGYSLLGEAGELMVLEMQKG